MSTKPGLERISVTRLDTDRTSNKDGYAQTVTDSSSIDDYLYLYKGKLYPWYLKTGDMTLYIEAIAKQFCTGYGVDIGCGEWCLEDAIPHDIKDGKNALDLPDSYDYIFSSHCLEHLFNPISALEYWKTKCKLLFLYLPHPDMEYWLPQNNRKHLHSWYPKEIVKILEDLGYQNIIHSERDLNWSFSVVAFNNVRQ